MRLKINMQGIFIMGVKTYLNNLLSYIVLEDCEKDKIRTSITTLVSRLSHYFFSNVNRSNILNL